MQIGLYFRQMNYLLVFYLKGATMVNCLNEMGKESRRSQVVKDANGNLAQDGKGDYIVGGPYNYILDTFANMLNLTRKTLNCSTVGEMDKTVDVLSSGQEILLRDWQTFDFSIAEESGASLFYARRPPG